jgi:hypothetical protein
MFLILKGHLVHARSVRNRSTAHIGNMFFTIVVIFILSAQMPSGRHFVSYVMGETVRLQCMHAFHYFLNITSCYYLRDEF